MAVASSELVVQQELAPKRSFLTQMRTNARRNPVGALAGLICVFLILLAIFGPYVAPHSASATNFPRLLAPNWTYPLGTDNLFRDLFSRIIIGARVTLGIGFSAVAVSLCLSIMLGVSSGYLGGKIDLLVSRMMDVMQAYPGIIFSIFFLTIMGPKFWTVALAIGIVLTPGATRIVRGATIGVRHMPYIEAAVSLGNSPLRIMWKHVLPNVFPSIIISASIQIGVAMLIESSLSFIGLGISSASNPSWGRMLQEMRPVWQDAWWTAVVPGFAISMAVLNFNLFGDALRDWLDPRLRGSR